MLTAMVLVGSFTVEVVIRGMVIHLPGKMALEL